MTPTPDPSIPTYRVKEFDLSGLQGISDETLELHFGLYKGYVENTNKLNSQIADLSGTADEGAPALSELIRRRGFEYNGMVLHEHYFGNMTRRPADLARDSAFHAAAVRSFGSVEEWKEDFMAVSRMRGVGWALTLQDPSLGHLSNHWVTLHEDGNIAGFRPIVVMDLWEHAYLLDYKPAEREKYVEAFFANVDWSVVASRLAPLP